MNLTVFGATRGVGREVASQALNRGDHVRAYVRNPAKLTITHPNLTAVSGELTDREAVHRAVRGADAVISALGPSLDRKATAMPRVDGTRTIVEAMHAEGVERYIGMATPSLRDPRDTRSLLGLVVPFMGRTFLKRAYRELLEMSEIVTASWLNWTIARFTQPKRTLDYAGRRAVTYVSRSDTNARSGWSWAPACWCGRAREVYVGRTPRPASAAASALRVDDDCDKGIATESDLKPTASNRTS
jgi:putative NADH-flavin reductase